MNPITDLKQALTYLTLGGAAIAASTFASIVLEKLAQFQKLADGAKLAITAGLSLLLGLGATALLTLPPETLQAAQPYFAAGILAVAPFIFQEVAHKFLKKPAVELTATSDKPATISATVSTPPKA